MTWEPTGDSAGHGQMRCVYLTQHPVARSRTVFQHIDPGMQPVLVRQLASFMKHTLDGFHAAVRAWRKDYDMGIVNAIWKTIDHGGAAFF